VKRFRAAILLVVSGVAAAQLPNPGGELNQLLDQETGGRFRLIFEFRVRDESRTGNNFGLAKNLDNVLLRTRIGAQFDATDWFRISATGQDARAPDYGGVAPTTARDSMDLHEAFLEFFARRKTGFGAVFGRQVISLGEGRGRLIGDSQWTNTSRSYDTARLYYRLPSARIEVLMVSQVKILADKFNVPDLGDRVWGTYDTFTRIIPKGTVDFYLLRHDQNRPGGFTGIGNLGTNTLGGRAEGPLPGRLKYSMETAIQDGHTGLVEHRGYAWFSGISRPVHVGLPLDLEVEYKYASGSRNAATRDGTFDQLYASNHDRFGRADLFGWRNIHNMRSLETLHVTKPLAISGMYNNWWLASPTDALYNSSGGVIVRSAKGTAGTHIAQEADLFGTYQASGWTFGAGMAHIFAGDFLRATTPGVNTRYLFVFQSYTFGRDL
jgi:hypothetical protein